MIEFASHLLSSPSSAFATFISFLHNISQSTMWIERKINMLLEKRQHEKVFQLESLAQRFEDVEASNIANI